MVAIQCGQPLISSWELPPIDSRTESQLDRSAFLLRMMRMPDDSDPIDRNNCGMSTSPPSDPKTVPVNRMLVGLISIGCLITAAGLWFRYGDTDDDWMLWIAGFIRAGTFMGAVWLALPSKSRDAAWARISWPALIGSIVGLLVVVRRPKMMIPLLVVVGVIGFGLRFLGRGTRPSDRDRPDRSSWK